MTNPISTLAPLVTREALNAFTQRLVEHFAPKSSCSAPGPVARTVGILKPICAPS